MRMTSVLAISAKAYSAVFVAGVALSDVENPVLALGAVSAALLAVLALFGKAWRWLQSSIETNRRQARMLAQFEGTPDVPGVMDEIKSLHVGQADILLAVADLKRLSVCTREDLP